MLKQNTFTSCFPNSTQFYTILTKTPTLDISLKGPDETNQELRGENHGKNKTKNNNYDV